MTLLSISTRNKKRLQRTRSVIKSKSFMTELMMIDLKVGEHEKCKFLLMKIDVPQDWNNVPCLLGHNIACAVLFSIGNRGLGWADDKRAIEEDRNTLRFRKEFRSLSLNRRFVFPLRARWSLLIFSCTETYLTVFPAWTRVLSLAYCLPGSFLLNDRRIIHFENWSTMVGAIFLAKPRLRFSLSSLFPNSKRSDFRLKIR